MKLSDSIASLVGSLYQTPVPLRRSHGRFCVHGDYKYPRRSVYALRPSTSTGHVLVGSMCPVCGVELVPTGQTLRLADMLNSRPVGWRLKRKRKRGQ